MKFPPKYRILASGIAALIVIELILRLAFGFGNPVLSQADVDTGYRFQPNQKIFRFGKEIDYNQYSQRSEPITPEKPHGKLRILMTGDSVLNGGNPTNQDQTITELFETKLSKSGHPAEVLNASAGSWGIGNELGYLNEFGMFSSDAIILQIGTHDLTQPTSTSERVGNDPNYPNQKPLLAIQEVWSRYASPQLSAKFGIGTPSVEIPLPSPTEIDRQFQQNMEMLKAIISQAHANKARIFVLFTPNREDLIPKPKIPKYKSEFLQLLNSLQVPAIDTHTAWSTLPQKTVATYFRDGVHLTVAANQAVADLLIKGFNIEGYSVKN
jgi:lysophospholipase L1-like esterase